MKKQMFVGALLAVCAWMLPLSASAETFSCESVDGNYQECVLPSGRNLRLVRQLSNADCVEGRTWGRDGSDTVWVRGGCRAEFAVEGYGNRYENRYRDQDSRANRVDSAYNFKCESRDGGHRVCEMPRVGDAVLLEQLSSASCEAGRSWGMETDHSIWVDNGCRGVFGVQ